LRNLVGDSMPGRGLSKIKKGQAQGSLAGGCREIRRANAEAEGEKN
jgi:hypothetical protein